MTVEIEFSDEVRNARAANLPLVALESSVIAQGLPPPHNLAAALACEAAVRAEGAVPATVAVIDGKIRVGLERSELERLAAPDAGHRKLGAKDVAVALSARQTGGTTVSAALAIAANAGLRVFATGGVGGVHRGAEHTFDVSQDLHALARYPLVVVCAGAKSILDLPKTLEVLETLGVAVVGVGTNELPAFLSRTSGLALEHRVDGVHEAAALARTHLAFAHSALLFTLPPPEHAALDADDVETAIREALGLAQEAGVRGKALTPWLLHHVALRTAGRTLGANLALLENNARFAAALAAEMNARC